MPVLLSALLTGCAGLPPDEEPVSAARPPRAGIESYAVSGRIAARHEQSRHHASIAWRHAPDADEIMLTGPLGQGIARIERDARGARLVTAQKEVIEAADWEELSRRVFGFELPLSGLPRWLVGDVASPTAVDADGRPLAARQQGWRIRYLAYESARADALPVLIELDRGDTEVRFKVDAWQLD